MAEQPVALPGPVEVPAEVFDPERLAAVRASGLLDTPPEATFDDLAGLAAEMTGARWAFVTIVDEDRSYWKSAVGMPAMTLAERQGPVGESFCKYLIATGGPVALDDVRADPRVRDNPTVDALGIGAWAGFPVTGRQGEVLGSFCVIDDRARPWTDAQMQNLATLARAVSGEIGLRQALHRAEALAEQLQESGAASAALVRTLQTSLLPPHLPPVPGVQAAAAYLAAGTGEVTGDFYDLFPAGDGSWCAVLGDVAGKGVDAAKVTALARYTVRAEATQADRPSPAAVLSRLNAALLSQGGEDGRLLTAICVVFTPADGSLTGLVCTAGHPPAMLRRRDGTVETVGKHGMLLGALPQPVLHDTPVRLAAGDVLVLYTDGITEARPARTGRLFGEAGLRDTLSSAGTRNAQETIDMITTAAVRYAAGALRDDTALLALRIPEAEELIP